MIASTDTAAASNPGHSAGADKPELTAKDAAAAPTTSAADEPGTEKAGAGAGTGRADAAPAATLADGVVNPLDFHGDILTDDDLPSAEIQRKVADYVVLDRHGKAHPFKSLYSGPDVPQRVLVIFIRHFYCGVCQDYLRTIADAITPEALLGLPASTLITVVGCGDPALIDVYAEVTGCRFPIYADPTLRLYDGLGMIKSLAMGPSPGYLRRSMLKGSLSSILMGLRQLTTGLATKGGPSRQNGGEFLFEPADGPAEKRVTWCHRMRNTRDHTEVPELVKLLGLDGQGRPSENKKP